MDVVDETQDVVDVLDPVDGFPGVPKPCAQVRILPGALAERLVRTLRGSGVTRRPVGIPRTLLNKELSRGRLGS